VPRSPTYDEPPVHHYLHLRHARPAAVRRPPRREQRRAGEHAARRPHRRRCRLRPRRGRRTPHRGPRTGPAPRRHPGADDRRARGLPGPRAVACRRLHARRARAARRRLLVLPGTCRRTRAHARAPARHPQRHRGGSAPRAEGARQRTRGRPRARGGAAFLCRAARLRTAGARAVLRPRGDGIVPGRGAGPRGRTPRQAAACPPRPARDVGRRGQPSPLRGGRRVRRGGPRRRDALHGVDPEHRPLAAARGAARGGRHHHRPPRPAPSDAVGRVRPVPRGGPTGARTRM
ncbi:MAG: Glycerophosphoryl diester phosphodiesterase, partial [uncultured Nocardioidaceae bacterium]